MKDEDKSKPQLMSELAEMRRRVAQLQSLERERKRAVEELRSSEERLKILFEYAPDAYYLNDLKGKFVDGNKAAEEITGYRRSELIGKSFLKLKLLPLRQVTKAATLLARNAIGKPTGPDEFTLKRQNGTQVEVEIRTFPVKIKKRTLVLGIARDITERKKMEEALRESEEKHRLLFEEGSDAIFLADVETGTLLDANKQAERLLGRRKKEIIGMHQSQLHPPGKAEYHKEKFSKYIQSGRAADFEAAVVKKDGTIVPVHISAAVMELQGKEIIQGVFRDVTELKNAQERLAQKMQELERFNRIAVARELRMIELKRQVNELAQKTGEAPPYKLSSLRCEDGRGISNNA